MAKDNTKRLQDWAITHQKASILIGVAIIQVGITFDIIYEKTHSILLFIPAHLFIVFGEVITVTFFLHLFIEEKKHEQNAQMLFKLGNASTLILENQAIAIKEEFQKLIFEFKDKADLIIDDINESLFEAILKDKLPHQIVKPLLDSNFFSAEILRKNLVLTFNIKEVIGDKLILIQRTEFELEYVFGAKTEYFYEMPISLTNTPVADYELKEVGYRRFIEGNKEWNKFKIGQGIKKEGDDCALENLIKIQKNERIKVFQEVAVVCTIGKFGIFDNYCSFHHTIAMRVDILNLPDDYEFKLYPTFESNKFKNPSSITGTKISYKDIEFLVAGQGIGFSLSRKNKL